MRKTVIAVAALATGAAATAALTGSAFASAGDVAAGGAGGTATDNCLNVGVPVLSGLGIAGQGTAAGATCAATANGGAASAY